MNRIDRSLILLEPMDVSTDLKKLGALRGLFWILRMHAWKVVFPAFADRYGVAEKQRWTENADSSTESATPGKGK
jgi:hypothetical protein